MPTQKLVNIVPDFIGEQVQTGSLSQLMGKIEFIVITHFVNHLRDKGVKYTQELKPRHIDSYHKRHLACFEEMIHEIVWAFYMHVKKKRKEETT